MLDERKTLLAEIERQETMLSNARKQIAAGEIDADDFKVIKADCNKALMLLEDKLSNLPNKGDSLKTIENLLDLVIVKFSDIQGRFKRAPIAEKRKLIGSIYPKNLCFDGTGHRTPYINAPLSLIIQINKQLKGKKKGEKYTKCDFSPLVAPTGIILSVFVLKTAQIDANKFIWNHIDFPEKLDIYCLFISYSSTSGDKKSQKRI